MSGSQGGLPVIPFTFNVLWSTETLYVPAEEVGGQVLVAHSCNTGNRGRECKMANGAFVHDYGNRNYRVRKFGLVFDNERLSPNWYRKPRESPPNPLDNWEKYQTQNGVLSDVRVGELAIVTVADGKVGILKVESVNKQRRVIRWWGGENKTESLFEKIVPLNKNNQPWKQVLYAYNGVIAANFKLENGMLPNEVLALVDWDWRTTWNLSTEYGPELANDADSEERGVGFLDL
jgi:hypothetical protein